KPRAERGQTSLREPRRFVGAGAGVPRAVCSCSLAGGPIDTPREAGTDYGLDLSSSAMSENRESDCMRPQRAILVLVACLATRPLVSEVPKPAKISAFAPAKDLLEQVDFYIGRVEQSLAEPADFDEAKQSRTVKDANTLAVLALVLGAHDEQHPLKESMPAMLKGAQALA